MQELEPESFEVFFDLFERDDDAFEGFLLFAELLGARGVVPDVRVFELLADFDQLLSFGIVVKDTSEVRALGP